MVAVSLLALFSLAQADLTELEQCQALITTTIKAHPISSQSMVDTFGEASEYKKLEDGYSYKGNAGNFTIECTGNFYLGSQVIIWITPKGKASFSFTSTDWINAQKPRKDKSFRLIINKDKNLDYGFDLQRMYASGNEKLLKSHKYGVSVKPSRWWNTTEIHNDRTLQTFSAEDEEGFEFTGFPSDQETYYVVAVCDIPKLKTPFVFKDHKFFNDQTGRYETVAVPERLVDHSLILSALQSDKPCAICILFNSPRLNSGNYEHVLVSSFPVNVAQK